MHPDAVQSETRIACWKGPWRACAIELRHVRRHQPMPVVHLCLREQSVQLCAQHAHCHPLEPAAPLAQRDDVEIGTVRPFERLAQRRADRPSREIRALYIDAALGPSDDIEILLTDLLTTRPVGEGGRSAISQCQCFPNRPRAASSNIVKRLIRLLARIAAQRIRSGLLKRMPARTRQIKAADECELVVIVETVKRPARN